jgi:hypothetical protein
MEKKVKRKVSDAMILFFMIFLVFSCDELEKFKRHEGNSNTDKDMSDSDFYEPDDDSIEPDTDSYEPDIVLSDSEADSVFDELNIADDDVFDEDINDNDLNETDEDEIVINVDLVQSWTKQWGAHRSDEGEDIAIDSNGNIYIAGTVDGNFDGDPTEDNRAYEDVFLMKIQSNGTVEWLRQFGTKSFDYENPLLWIRMGTSL